MHWPRFSLAQLLTLLTGVALVMGCYVSLTRVEEGENLPRVSWLPKSATSVSYYRSYSFTAFEFDISEAEFRDWASGYDLRPISQPLLIHRYSYFTASRQLPQAKSVREYLRLNAARTVSISSGWGYEDRWTNGGGVVVAYDRATGRAYFQSNPR